jgi:glycosyltransferase involved in cell wall biosynthesis
MWLKENRIDIVHSHTYHAHIYSVLAARLAGACSVVHQHKTIERPKTHRWLTTWMLVRAASGLVALSEKTREDFALSYGIKTDRITVVPNAVDRTEFSPPASKTTVRQQLGLPTGVFLLGSVASLQKVKNHDATIDAASRLASMHPALQVVIIGEGPERLALEQRVRNLGLESQIRLVGNQRPVSPWIQALDLFVLASHWEGQSLAVLQAISCDVPVLASRIEGNTQTLGEDHPGLFDQTNLEDYIALVRRAMQHTGFRQELIMSQTRHRVPDTSEAAAKFGDLYRGLAAQTALARG